MHGNSHENMNPHHLYAIDDVVDNEVLKFGITDDPLGEDGLPERLRNQINLYNIVANVVRFVGRIILSGIPGRAKAEEIEAAHIADYEQKHGKKPRGNRERSGSKK